MSEKRRRIDVSDMTYETLEAMREPGDTLGETIESLIDDRLEKNPLFDRMLEQLNDYGKKHQPNNSEVRANELLTLLCVRVWNLSPHDLYNEMVCSTNFFRHIENV